MMDLKGVNLVQQVSNSKISKNSMLGFRNKIENKSGIKISNIVLQNYISVDFSKKYYEFEKSREAIEISNVQGEITINELLPNDEVIIYTSVPIEGDIFLHQIKSYCNIQFLDDKGNEYNIKSNENVVEIIKERGISETGFKIEVNKNVIDEDDSYKLKIIVNNEGVIPITDVELINIIPTRAEFLKDSLYINKSFINTGNKLTTIKLGTVLPTQKIEIELSVKVNREYIGTKVENKVTLNYKYSSDEVQEEYESLESNLVEVEVRKSEIVNFKKISNKKEVRLGEDITFTITCKNTGNVKLYDLQFLDDIGKEFEYIENSFFINNRKSEVEKQDILRLDCLEIGEQIEYTYKCIAKQENNDNKVINLKYRYIGLDGMKSFEKEISYYCDKIEVRYADLNEVYKVVDKEGIFINEEATCEIILKNNGNVAAENIVVQDYLNEEIKLVNNTIFINGIFQEENNLSNLKINIIPSGYEAKIEYRIVGKDITTFKDKLHKNHCSLKYDYYVDGEKVSENKIFENKQVIVNGAIIKKEDLNKTLDKMYVGLDDEILVKLTFENSGNYIAEKVFIKENYNTSAVFIKGTLSVNGNLLSYDIEEGFLLGDIKPKETIEIVYKLKVIKIPVNKITLSTTNIIYESISSHRQERSSNMLVSQSKNIIVKSPNINFENGLFIREADKEIVEEGSIIKFRVFFRNNGNVQARNVVLKEILPSNFEIIDNKVYINGYCKTIINNEITMADIDIQEDFEIIYNVLVKKGENKNIETKSLVQYGYYLYDGSNFVLRNGQSNSVQIKRYNTEIIFINNSIKNEIEVNEEFEYSLYLMNKGDVNFYNGTISFEVDERIEIDVLNYKIDNIEQEIKYLTEQCYIEQLNINKSVLITLVLRIRSIGNKKRIAIKPIFKGEFYDGIKENSIIKIAEKKFIDIGFYNLQVSKRTARNTYIKDEVIDYSITILNNGMYVAENVLIQDESLYKGEVNGRIYVDNRILNDKYISGIPLEKIEIGQTVTIRYSIIYKNSNKEKYIKSSTKVTADFIDNSNCLKKYEFFSNEHILHLKEPKVEIIRSVDKEIIKRNERVRFFTIIKNIGDLELFDVQMRELNLKNFKREEVYINSLLVDIKDEFIRIPNLKVGDIYEIVTEYNYSYEQKSLEINNKALLEYNYKGMSKKNFFNIQESDELIIKINSNMFKNLNIKQKIYLDSFEDLAIAEITDLNVEVILEEQYIINSIKNKKNPLNIATGKKLMIHGQLKSNIEYIADDLTESLNMISNIEYFTTSIFVPEDTEDLREFIVKANIVNVSYKLLNKKNIITNISMSIEVF